MQEANASITLFIDITLFHLILFQLGCGLKLKLQLWSFLKYWLQIVKFRIPIMANRWAKIFLSVCVRACAM